jgi:hypothetical protein
MPKIEWVETTTDELFPLDKELVGGFKYKLPGSDSETENVLVWWLKDTPHFVFRIRKKMFKATFAPVFVDVIKAIFEHLESQGGNKK